MENRNKIPICITALIIYVPEEPRKENSLKRFSIRTKTNRQTTIKYIKLVELIDFFSKIFSYKYFTIKSRHL